MPSQGAASRLSSDSGIWENGSSRRADLDFDRSTSVLAFRSVLRQNAQNILQSASLSLSWIIW